MKTLIKLAALMLLGYLICLTLTGCGSDSCGPSPCQCGVTLETIWPNDDGRGWDYKFTWRTWDDTCEYHDDPEDVPPAPSLDVIEGLLGTQPIGDDVTTRVGSYTMTFDGDSTTMSGATGQALRDTANFPGEPYAHSGDMNSPRAFLEAYVSYRLAVAGDRPGFPSGALSGFPITPSPTLVHGGAWEKTDKYIGSYGDIDTELTWKFLEEDLCPGSEFDFEASSTGLRVRCRILEQTSVQTEMGVFENGLNCLYLVDLGVIAFGGEHGYSHYHRVIVYGNVIYVPEVGPVYSYERLFVCVGETLSVGSGDMEISLIATGTD